jgi:hypothetical protein
MKNLILLLTLSTFSCSFIYGQHKKTTTTKSQIKAKLIVCSGLTEDNIPLDNLNEINVKEDQRIVLYVEWRKLFYKSYVTSMDVLDANGKTLTKSGEHMFRTRKNLHYTWSSINFNKKVIPEGIITIRLHLDKKTILDRRVKVTYISK